MTEPKPRVLSLSEVAERLNMKRPNVAKFLARRGVSPAFEKAQGYFWWEADIERVKAEREADERRMAADAKRRESAVRGRRVERDPVPPELARLGSTQKRLLGELLRRPVKPEVESDRFALRRLRGRGLVVTLDDAPGTFALTDEGRSLAGQL